MGMKTKGVSFNLDNPKDAALYEKALSYENFSGKVKEWIKRDMETAARRTSNGGIQIRL